MAKAVSPTTLTEIYVAFHVPLIKLYISPTKCIKDITPSRSKEQIASDILYTFL